MVDESEQFVVHACWEEGVCVGQFGSGSEYGDEVVEYECFVSEYCDEDKSLLECNEDAEHEVLCEFSLAEFSLEVVVLVKDMMSVPGASSHLALVA